MKISYNAAAMRANNALNKSDQRLTTSLKRLSSGLKVTAAKENPSGYAIGRRMNAQIEGVSVATQSANNGISIIETADGALSEVHDMLQRMNELASSLSQDLAVLCFICVGELISAGVCCLVGVSVSERSQGFK